MFSLRPTQTDMFAFLVTGTLNGEVITDQHIREKKYPSRKADEFASVARGAVYNVRKLINQYYATDGADDLVMISFPETSEKGKRVKFQPGEGYRPRFSYNPRHPAMKQCTLGAFYSRRGSPTDLVKALEHFTKALQLHPGYADALIGMTWVFVGLVWFSTGDEKREYLAKAEQLSNVALERFPAYWRSHFMRAVVLAEKENLDEAMKEYGIALTLDAKSTVASVRRTPLLDKLGNSQTRLQLSEAYLEEHINDPEAYIVHATILMSMQRFDDAIVSAEAAIRMDNNLLGAHFIMAVCLIHKHRLPEADNHVERMKVLSDESTFARVSAILGYLKSSLEM